jgi:hypothetical protein
MRSVPIAVVLVVLVACGGSTVTTPAQRDASAARPDAELALDAVTPDGTGTAPSEDGKSSEAALDASIDVWRACPEDASPYTSCSAATGCCGGLTCEGARCCMPLGSGPCTAETVCCEPGICFKMAGSTQAICVAHTQ